MSLDHLPHRPGNSPCVPSSHTGTRPWSPSARGIVVTLFLLFGAALVPPAANADIVYTFHCDIAWNNEEPGINRQCDGPEYRTVRRSNPVLGCHRVSV